MYRRVNDVFYDSKNNFFILITSLMCLYNDVSVFLKKSRRNEFFGPNTKNLNMKNLSALDYSAKTSNEISTETSLCNLITAL